MKLTINFRNVKKVIIHKKNTYVNYMVGWMWIFCFRITQITQISYR